MEYVKLKTTNFRNHPRLTKRWLQEIIVEDSSMLGLGDVLVKAVSRDVFSSLKCCWVSRVFNPFIKKFPRF